MEKTVGYTYCIKFLLTSQIYYGSRCAKGCHPDEFWKTYFTSSKLVKKLVEQYGKDSFEVQIRKIFNDNPKNAQEWERRVLKRIKAGEKPNFLNKSNGVAPILTGWKNPFYGKKHSDETRKKMSAAAKRRTSDPTKCNMYGRKHSQETKNKISTAHKGKNYLEKYGEEKSLEIKRKLSEKLSGEGNPMHGKPRNDMIGDKNPAKREDVRKKLSESAKLRESKKRELNSLSEKK